MRRTDTMRVDWGDLPALTRIALVVGLPILELGIGMRMLVETPLTMGTRMVQTSAQQIFVRKLRQLRYSVPTRARLRRDSGQDGDWVTR